MKFHQFTARDNWRDQFKQLGFDDPYWWIETLDQPFCAEFTVSEVADLIVHAAKECNELALAAAQLVCAGEHSEALFEFLKIPPAARQAVRTSWQRHDPTLYGRFDFAYDGHHLKLLELNFDTPGTVCESSLLQRSLIVDLAASGALPSAGQFNRLAEKLSEAFSNIVPNGQVLHLASFERAREDTEDVLYLQNFARNAGVSTKFLYMDDLSRNQSNQLVDPEGVVITNLFKLHSWDLIFQDDDRLQKENGKPAFTPQVTSNAVRFLEPAWKSVLSKKAILPIMWQMAPNHPYLLQSYLDDGSEKALELKKQPHVRKPIFGWSGANITLVSEDGEETGLSAPDIGHGYVLQEYCRLAEYAGYHCVLSVWMVANEPVALSLRADRNRITGKGSLLVPHYIELGDKR